MFSYTGSVLFFLFLNMLAMHGSNSGDLSFWYKIYWSCRSLNCIAIVFASNCTKSFHTHLIKLVYYYIFFVAVFLLLVFFGHHHNNLKFCSSLSSLFFCSRLFSLLCMHTFDVMFCSSHQHIFNSAISRFSFVLFIIDSSIALGDTFHSSFVIVFSSSPCISIVYQPRAEKSVFNSFTSFFSSVIGYLEFVPYIILISY